MAVPALVDTVTVPSKTVIWAPSSEIFPETSVPRIPMVATGVVTVIFELSVLAISPDAKTKTPFKIENWD